MQQPERLIATLANRSRGPYRPGGPVASEPTALAALALLAHGQADLADSPLTWLAGHQQADGSVGVTAAQTTPAWPTGLAVLAWNACEVLSASDAHRAARDRGVHWILSARGESLPRNEFLAHDSTLVGWPWVAGTHSWVEPTAMQVLALKAVGHADHARTREAVRLLVDRCLPHGGWNYGNTIVLGQELRPHLLPTALALLALSTEPPHDERIGRSIEYLQRELPRCTAAPSLAYGVLALTAHHRRPFASDGWLQAGIERSLAREACTYPLALLALATSAAGIQLLAAPSEVAA